MLEALGENVDMELCLKRCKIRCPSTSISSGVRGGNPAAGSFLGSVLGQINTSIAYFYTLDSSRISANDVHPKDLELYTRRCLKSYS